MTNDYIEKWIVKALNDLKQDPDFKNLKVGNLSFYAVEIRYSDELYMPSVAEAKECFNIASKAKDFLLKKIG